MSYIATTYPEIEIKETRNGRYVTYGYIDSESSIFKLSFNDNELAQLTQCMAILSRFDGTPQMDWLQSFVERFKLYLNIDAEVKRVVGFDECRYLRGKEHFARLVSAICHKQVLSISYKNFKHDRIQEFIIHPYYIKEYNNRWFLLGLKDGYDTISTLAFDRIEQIEIYSGISYIPNQDIDFNDDYFSDIVGVTKPVGRSLEKVRLWVSPSHYPYIRTKPLHESQKLISEDEGGSIIELEIRPNYELEQLILSYGEGLKVLTPTSLREKIIERLSLCLKKY